MLEGHEFSFNLWHLLPQRRGAAEYVVNQLVYELGRGRRQPWKHPCGAEVLKANCESQLTEPSRFRFGAPFAREPPGPWIATNMRPEAHILESLLSRARSFQEEPGDVLGLQRAVFTMWLRTCW